MKQSDAVQFLYRDLQVVTSHLVFKDYDQVFEEEMQEFFPFSEAAMEWLIKLYASEKYSAFDENKLSLYYEKEHPFLFIRDLAHMNSWRLGFERKERRDHITGLMFSGNPFYAMESTFCICRPSQIDKEVSSWFDFKQAMTNLEKASPADWQAQAWKACAMFYLYFHLSNDPKSIAKEELVELIGPYQATLETALYEGEESLRQECGIITRVMRSENTQLMLDRLHI